jgi:RHS repeat-associated protein
MQARLSCSAHRRFRRAGHTLRDFNDNYQYDQNGNLLFQQPVGGVSTGFLENSPSTHYYWLPTPQGDILVGFDQGINSYAVYTDHLGTPRLVTKIDNPQTPRAETDTSNDLPLADYGQPEGISPQAIPVWQWSYSPFGADLANGYEARPTTMANNFKPDLWSWMGLPETGGADPNQVAQETWRIQANLSIPPVLNIRYPGQYYDFEAGLVQNWWRTYEPKIGRYTSADPIGLGGGWNRFAYVEGDGINLSDRMGLATQSDIKIATDVIRKYIPEIYHKSVSAITTVSNLSNWYGAPLQGYTDLKNNIQINANLYGDCKTPVDEFVASDFLQTIAHEWQHAQQSTFEKALTHGTLHHQLDRNAALIAERVLLEFQRKRKTTPQDSCTCSLR